MIVVRAPFRLPLGGGGTDLPSYYEKFGGSLITSAINKYMYINVNKPAIVDKIIIKYSKVECVAVEDICKINHDIVRESFKYLNIDCALEISSMADLSAGTGMGSSSSYVVGLLRALNQLKKRFISTEELAKDACKIEIDLVGKPIGKQDQYASAFGGIIEMDIDRSGYVKVSSLNLNQEVIYELENRLMMFYTNIERDANEILDDQGKRINSGYNSINTGTKKEEGNREKHEENALEAMHKIREIGQKVKNSLIRGDVCEFGKLLHEHWLTKKSVSDKMSNTKIDNWYDIALKNGALGGKVMGAGGGGFMLFCVGNGKRKHLRKTMEEAGLKYMDFKFDWEGVKVLANV